MISTGVVCGPRNSRTVKSTAPTVTTLAMNRGIGVNRSCHTSQPLSRIPKFPSTKMGMDSADSA